MTHVVVIGGGIAGLAAAHRLLERDDAPRVTLLEAGELGGALVTERIDGYLVEGGGDMFITDKPAGVRLCERLGIAERLVAPNERYRRSLVLRNGKPAPVPEGFVLMAPTDMAALAMSPVLSPLGKLRMAAEVLLPRRNGVADESIASFVRRRFGREALDRLVQPLVGGIYTGDPERLSLRATLPRFSDMEKKHGSVIAASLRQRRRESGARYGLFVTLPQGIGELVRVLARRVAERGGRIELGARVVDIQPGFRVELADRDAVAADAVIVAIPAWRAAPLLERLSPALAARLERIPYASTAVVVSGHRLKEIEHPLDAFGLVVPHREHRSVLAVSFASRKFDGRAPEGRVLLRTFVGGALQPELYALADEAIERLVRRELADMLGVRGEPDFMRVVRHPRSMPQYELGHVALVDAVETELTRVPRLALAGNAYRGVGIPDCIQSGENAAERVMSDLLS